MRPAIKIRAIFAGLVPSDRHWLVKQTNKLVFIDWFGNSVLFSKEIIYLNMKPISYPWWKYNNIIRLDCQKHYHVPVPTRAVTIPSFILGGTGSSQFCALLLYPGQSAVFTSRTLRWQIAGKDLTENNHNIRLDKYINRNGRILPVPPSNKVIDLLHLFRVL
jgi:hypothetical protein